MLTERQFDILKTIIELYTTEEQPIGSKTLLEKSNMDLSSATIRNEMSVLEEAGLIEKTHTSSGRVPSVKGYRFYVDHLMQQDALIKDAELHYIRKALSQQFKKMDDIMNRSAEVLSDLTSYTAIILGPEATTSRLTGFRLVPLNGNQVMAILLTDNGDIENMVFSLPAHVDYSDMEKTVRIIEDVLIGHSLTEVYKKLRTEIPLLVHKYAKSAEGLLSHLIRILEQTPTNRLHISGKTNLLDFTEHLDTHQVKSIYQLFDDGVNLASLLASEQEAIDVKIGDELKNELFSDFSLVTANYEVFGHGEGTIAILGPTSMSYDKTISLLNTFRHELPNILLRFYLE